MQIECFILVNLLPWFALGHRWWVEVRALMYLQVHKVKYVNTNVNESSNCLDSEIRGALCVEYNLRERRMHNVWICHDFAFGNFRDCERCLFRHRTVLDCFLMSVAKSLVCLSFYPRIPLESYHNLTSNNSKRQKK